MPRVVIIGGSGHVGTYLVPRLVEFEPGQDRKHVAGELAAELRQMQEWLRLDNLEVASRGDLAAALRRAVRR